MPDHHEMNAEPGEYRLEGMPIDPKVDRVLTDVRLALLGVLLTIGLTVGFGVPGPWWLRLSAAGGSILAAASVLRWHRSQALLGDLMHSLLGR